MFQRASLRNNLLYYLSVLCLLSCKEKTKPLPYFNTPDFTPYFIDNKEEVNRKITHLISDFKCKDQNNTTITQKTIEGKIHVANFFFTACGSICPTSMSNLSKVSYAFLNDNDVVILSYSVTPWIDRVARLKQYALGNKVSDVNWHLLTGSKGEIYTLARKSYFAEEELGFDKDSTNFLHTEHFILVDKHKRIRGVYNGTLQLEADLLISDIKQLKEEE